MSDAQPREELGALLSSLLACPMCRDPATALANPQPGAKVTRNPKPVRIVAFRARSIRLQCRDCGLRFSIEPENFADVYADNQTPPPRVIERNAHERAGGDPAEYKPALAEMQRLARDFRAEHRQHVLAPHRAAIRAAVPRKGRIRLPKRST